MPFFQNPRFIDEEIIEEETCVPFNRFNLPNHMMAATIHRMLSKHAWRYPHLKVILKFMELQGVYLSGSFLLAYIEYISRQDIRSRLHFTPNDTDFFVDNEASLKKIRSLIRSSGLFSLDNTNSFKTNYDKLVKGIELTVDTYLMKDSTYDVKKVQIIYCKNVKNAIKNFDLNIVRNYFWLFDGRPQLYMENYNSIVKKRIEVGPEFSFKACKFRERCRLRKYIIRGYKVVKVQKMDHNELFNSEN